MARNQREKKRIPPISPNISWFCHKFQLEFALEKFLELKFYLKMSAQRVQMDSEASSQSSDSGPVDPGPLSSLEKTKKKTSVGPVGHEIFNIPFKQIGRRRGHESRHMKKRICLPSTSKLDWVIESIENLTLSIPLLYSVISTQEERRFPARFLVMENEAMHQITNSQCHIV